MATALGMIILVVGILFIFIGQMFPNLQNKGIFCALWIFGGTFIGIGGNPAKDAPNGSPGMVFVGVICAVVGLVMLLIPIFSSRGISQNTKTILIIIFIFIIIGVIFSTCSSSDSGYDSGYDSSYGSKSSSKSGGFIGSDGKYHSYVPEFGDDVNNWMANNW